MGGRTGGGAAAAREDSDRCRAERESGGESASELLSVSCVVLDCVSLSFLRSAGVLLRSRWSRRPMRRSESVLRPPDHEGPQRSMRRGARHGGRQGRMHGGETRGVPTKRGPRPSTDTAEAARISENRIWGCGGRSAAAQQIRGIADRQRLYTLIINESRRLPQSSRPDHSMQ